jgi:6-phosphogluconolactonase
MPPATVRTFPDAEAVSRAAAEEFVRCAGEAVNARGRFTVVLSGGSTPKRMYQLLAAPPLRDRVDWPRVFVFWGDERAVPPDHPDANYHTAHAELLTKVPVPAGNVFRMEGERPLAAAAADYQEAVARALGVPPDGPPPALDLVLLGMGPDGHTASLFPGNDALAEGTRWVVPVHGAPKPPPDRLTMTAPLLNTAREVLFLVAGADKADRLAEVLDGPPDPHRLPSQLVRPAGGLLVWYVDRSAAAKLKPPADRD